MKCHAHELSLYTLSGEAEAEGSKLLNFSFISVKKATKPSPSTVTFCSIGLLECSYYQCDFQHVIVLGTPVIWGLRVWGLCMTTAAATRSSKRRCERSKNSRKTVIIAHIILLPTSSLLSQHISTQLLPVIKQILQFSGFSPTEELEKIMTQLLPTLAK
jgi:hypothetical protein